MMPGPNLVLACPVCERPLRQATLASGNAFGGTLWSDGFGDYPMLPQFPSISRCPHCAVLFWVDGAEEIGSFEPWADGDSRWADAPYLAHLGVADMEEALAAGMGGEDRELKLRILLWWAHNDDARQGGATPDGSAFLGNLEGVRRLLGSREAGDRLMRAEAFREAGEFDSARRELDAPFPPEMQDYVAIVRRAAEAGDLRVLVLA